jgi:signal transduction histidine kinase
MGTRARPARQAGGTVATSGFLRSERVDPTRATRNAASPAQATNVWDSLSLAPWAFLRSAWPWRSVVYLLTGVALGASTLVVAFSLILSGALLIIALAGILAFVALCLLGIPVTGLERMRLRIVDDEPLPAQHVRVTEPGLWPWVKVRLREESTWRELAFVVLSVLGLCWVDLGMLMVAIGFPVLLMATPLYSSDPAYSTWIVGASGIPFLVPAAYLVTAWAAARATLARAMLGPRGTELGARLSEVSRSRARLVAAFEDERRLIERDLHDGAQRHLVAVSMSLGLARLDLPSESPAVDQVDKAQQHAERALAELRALIRGVHPRVLTDRGLAAAIADVAGDVPVPVDVDVGLSERLTPELETTVYFCLSELLTNVTRHSGATRARVSLVRRDGHLLATVWDDGGGGANPSAGRGLAGLADRLAVHDGELTLRSPPGGPTEVRLTLPLTPAGA